MGSVSERQKSLSAIYTRNARPWKEARALAWPAESGCIPLNVCQTRSGEKPPILKGGLFEPGSPGQAEHACFAPYLLIFQTFPRAALPHSGRFPHSCALFPSAFPFPIFLSQKVQHLISRPPTTLTPSAPLHVYNEFRVFPSQNVRQRQHALARISCLVPGSISSISPHPCPCT